MPLPMVHIETTIKIYEVLGKEPSPMFLLGCISPDAIHMRENAKREDKNETHLRKPDKDNIEAAISEFINKYIYMYPGINEFEFIKGYAIHVLTDLYWRDTVYKMFKNSIPKSISEDEAKKIYYKDTDQIDFFIYHKKEWSPKVWEQLRGIHSFVLNGLLTGEEIENWKKRTLAFFEDSTKEPKIIPKYITEDEVMNFIDDAANYCIDLFKNMDLKF